MPKGEYVLFDKLKNELTTEQYEEFMKAFYLYIEGILNLYEFH